MTTPKTPSSHPATLRSRQAEQLRATAPHAEGRPGEAQPSGTSKHGRQAEQHAERGPRAEGRPGEAQPSGTSK